MTDIINLGDRRPTVNAELVAMLGDMLREARAGRLVEIAAIYKTADDEYFTVLHFENALEAMGAIDFLHATAADYANPGDE